MSYFLYHNIYWVPAIPWMLQGNEDICETTSLIITWCWDETFAVKPKPTNQFHWRFTTRIIYFRKEKWAPADQKAICIGSNTPFSFILHSFKLRLKTYKSLLLFYPNNLSSLDKWRFSGYFVSVSSWFSIRILSDEDNIFVRDLWLHSLVSQQIKTSARSVIERFKDWRRLTMMPINTRLGSLRFKTSAWPLNMDWKPCLPWCTTGRRSPSFMMVRYLSCMTAWVSFICFISCWDENETAINEDSCLFLFHFSSFYPKPNQQIKTTNLMIHRRLRERAGSPDLAHRVQRHSRGRGH